MAALDEVGHWYSDHPQAWVETRLGARRISKRRDSLEIAHKHKKGEPCTEKCEVFGTVPD